MTTKKPKNKIVAFKDILPKYDAVFFDAFGVLNTAQGLLAGVKETLRFLTSVGKPFFVISNDSSVPVEHLSAKYDTPEYGNLVPPERIVCSGVIAQHYLDKTFKNKPLRIVYMGQKSAEVFLRGENRDLISAIDINNHTEADIFALMSVNGYDWQTTLNRCVNFIRRQGKIKLLCPNPDLLFHSTMGEVGIAAGGLAAAFSALLHKEFRYFGKPEVDIFDFTYQRLKNIKLKTKIPRKKILMVGDGLRTDILGAKKAGFDSALVLTGITTPENLAEQMAYYKVKPTYVCRDVGI